jgi:quinoprotein glucose dehydrogenase
MLTIKRRRVRGPLTCLFSLALSASFAESNESGDWSYYSGNSASTKYAPFDQIDRTNFEDLRIVWRWRMPDHEIMDANEGVKPGWSNRVTPIVIDGVMYTSTPLDLVLALNAETSEELWRFDPKAWSEESDFLGLHRGVSYWSDGEGGKKRVVFGTCTGYMYSLDALTGDPDLDFGDGGRVDLTEGLDRPIERRAYANPSPPREMCEATTCAPESCCGPSM